MGKKEIYAAYGIEYNAGKLIMPDGKPVAPLLINGNAKLGKGVWTWSVLPGTESYTIDGKTVCGTCACDCVGCYAKTGFYRMGSTIKALAIRTQLARNSLDWTRRAITAQIHADNIRLCRIHASGDFFSGAYINAWVNIANDCPDCVFWTYTKIQGAAECFDSVKNVNVVKSIIPGIGFNFGHCDYIISAYETLKAQGKQVHICKCGFDKNQHCVNCKGCSENEYVLFVEHSTSYKAENDTNYGKLAEMVNI